ncbi:MAG: hypothetical protein ABH829_05755 [archaeon]
MVNKRAAAGLSLLIAVLVAISGCIDIGKPDMPKEPKFMPDAAFNVSCEADSDCTMAGERFSKDHCCAGCGPIPVNVKAAEIRENWISDNCGPIYHTAYYCPVYECVQVGVPGAAIKKLICKDNSCTLEETV